MKIKTITASMLLVGASVAIGADERGDGIVKVAETEHFVFMAARRDGKTLKVNPGRCERAFADLSVALGVVVPGKTTYTRVKHPEEVSFLAGEPSRWLSGVANPRLGTIFSVMPHHEHEIVHIVAAQLGEPGAFFSEGLAVALGDKGKMKGRDVDDLARVSLRRETVQSVLESFYDVEAIAAYSIAGSFVRYLAKRYGLEKVAAFFRQADGRRGIATFEKSFGVSLDSSLAEWQATL